MEAREGAHIQLEGVGPAGLSDRGGAYEGALLDWNGTARLGSGPHVLIEEPVWLWGVRPGRAFWQALRAAASLAMQKRRQALGGEP